MKDRCQFCSGIVGKRILPQVKVYSGRRASYRQTLRDEKALIVPKEFSCRRCGVLYKKSRGKYEPLAGKRRTA